MSTPLPGKTGERVRVDPEETGAPSRAALQKSPSAWSAVGIITWMGQLGCLSSDMMVGGGRRVKSKEGLA